MFQKSLIFEIILTLFACDSVTTVATVPQSHAKVAGGPIVVELFQSQGCSSCPPTNAAFNLIADRADLIPLSFAVTYWDNLGWKDRFAKPAFTQRQRDYAKTLRVGAGVYTPQVVINGARGLVGNKPDELARAIAKSRVIAGGPALTPSAGAVHIGAGTGRSTVWLVRYNPKERRVAISAGENDGRTLPHRNVVRALTPLGTWTGAAAQFSLPGAREPGLRGAVLVQDMTSGQIVAATRLPPPR